MKYEDPKVIAEQDKLNPTELVLTTKKRQIRPRTATQAAFIEAMNNHDMFFGLFLAGSGKTF